MLQPCWTKVFKALFLYVLILGYEIIPINACRGCEEDWSFERCRNFILKCASSQMGKRSQHPLHRILSADIYDKVEMNIQTGEWEDNESSSADQDNQNISFLLRKYTRDKAMDRHKNDRTEDVYYSTADLYFHPKEYNL
ncbi:uncharacterized protein [Amphiura filiformis]|uniref:uncharacterized protein isoform X2 n=1 Tax=Amphiura filiformis TaxID=82378 RepID=UPI003B217402